MLPQFLVVFREALEAGLIVGIISAYLTRIHRADARKYLYLGAVAAAAVSVGLAAFISATFGGLGSGGRELFEGFASLVAAAVLTYMILWMAAKARTIRETLEGKVSASIQRNQVLGIFGLAFASVAREGLETVLFITPLALSDPLGTLAGTIGGLSAVVILTFLTTGALARMNLTRLFRYTSILLLLFAAGLVGTGVHELMEAYEGRIPTFLARPAWDVNPTNPRHPLHENGALGSVFKSLVGYDGNPEVLRVVVYASYWVILGLAIHRAR